MFDSAPSNLPVEPPVQPQPTPVPSPAVPPPAPTMPPPPSASPQPLSTGTARKEPEDIFSGLDSVPPSSADTGDLDLGGPAPHRSSSPLTFVLIAILIVLLVGGVGFGVWYFLIREAPVASPSVATTTSGNPALVPTEEEPIVEVPPILPGSESNPNLPPPQSITTTTEPMDEPTPEPEPEIVRTEAIDSDGDGLSDPEELVLGTEATMMDSDGDGYGDASELQSGYDPAAARVAQSASPRFQTASIAGRFTVILPALWSVATDPSSPGNYVIQTGTPTSFPVRLSTLMEGTTFSSWFSENEPSRSSADLVPSRTANGLEIYTSSDRLRTYVVIPGTVVTISYEPNTATSYDYRVLYAYLIQSLRVQ